MPWVQHRHSVLSTFILLHCTQRHNGVNLVVGDLRTGRTAYVTNRGPEGAVRGPRELARGLHALSNATLDEAWPKACAAAGCVPAWDACTVVAFGCVAAFGGGGCALPY